MYVHAQPFGVDILANRRLIRTHRHKPTVEGCDEHPVALKLARLPQSEFFCNIKSGVGRAKRTFEAEVADQNTPADIGGSSDCLFCEQVLVEILQPGVGGDGHHDFARPQLSGEIERGSNIEPGRCSDQKALLFG